MNRIFSIFFFLSCLCVSLQGLSQSLSEKYASLLTIPKGYVCYRTAGPIRIDGLPSEDSWKNVPYTDAFVDISGYDFLMPRYRTTVKMLWDDSYLYVFADMEEPHIWANLHRRDTIVYYDNDFEVFIDPAGEGHNYFEIEANAIGTVFDLALEKPYRAPHRPFVQFQWNCPGLKLATHIDGKLNDPKGTDRGWSVEMAIPREAIASEFINYLKAGSWLRIDFSRVEWQHELNPAGRYGRKKRADGTYFPEDNWVWTPTGRIAMHMPERWGYLYLSDKKAGEGTEAFRYPASQPVCRFLWMLFYAQEEHYGKYRKYWGNLSDFRLQAKDMQLLPDGYRIVVEATSHTYEITAFAPDGREYVIDESGRCFIRFCDMNP